MVFIDYAQSGNNTYTDNDNETTTKLQRNNNETTTKLQRNYNETTTKIQRIRCSFIVITTKLQRNCNMHVVVSL
jgi:hypothetical protein